MPALSETQIAELKFLWGKPIPGSARRYGVKALARRFNTTEGTVRGLRTRLKLRSPSAPEKVKGLRRDHNALVEGRTLFTKQVFPPPSGAEPRRSPGQGGFVLVSGANHVKFGRMIEKGPWAGMPLFVLTLEERATCPRECHNWGICYGNSSQWQKRYQHGPELEARLDYELAELQDLYPDGFVIRLHQLGDFYSPAYVQRWKDWLDRFGAIRVFGYTAWTPLSEIGAAVAELTEKRWDRFAIRLSSTEPGPGRAITLRSASSADEAARNEPRNIIVCPFETDQTETCSTCALCWSASARDKTIAFLAHGK